MQTVPILSVIYSISQADSSCLWISTHLEVNRFSQKTRQMVGNYDFSGDYYVHSNNQGNTWVLGSGGIYYYNTKQQSFIRVQTLALPMDYMEQRAFVIDDGVLWLFPSSVVTDSVCAVQTADGFLYQIILIGRTFFRSGVVRRR